MSMKQMPSRVPLESGSPWWPSSSRPRWINDIVEEQRWHALQAQMAAEQNLQDQTMVASRRELAGVTQVTYRSVRVETTPEWLFVSARDAFDAGIEPLLRASPAWRYSQHRAGWISELQIVPKAVWTDAELAELYTPAPKASTAEPKSKHAPLHQAIEGHRREGQRHGFFCPGSDALS